MKRSIIFLSAILFSTPSFSDLAPEFDGVWKTDGYGTLAEIKNGQVKFYQVAGEICIAETTTADALAALVDNSQLVLAQDGQLAKVRLPFAQHEIRAQRLDTLPDACQTPVENTPESNFEAFSAFLENNYPFFAVQGVDWQTTLTNAREKLRPDTSDRELFEFFKGMIAPLRDGHIGLGARIENDYLRFEPHPGAKPERLLLEAGKQGIRGQEALDAFLQPLWFETIRETILGGQGQIAGNQRIQYGILNGDTGYLALATVGFYDQRDASPQEEMAATDAIMEEIMQTFQEAGVHSVIIDLSMNYGGYSNLDGYAFIARAIAERFASKPVVAYTKYAADAENPVRTDVTLTPSNGTRFEGPVFVLTSNITVHAGEILTLSLRALPNVTHVGEPTRGALSDSLDRTLPNGWHLSLANEVHVDREGRFWEGRGISPHIAMDVFKNASPDEHHVDLVMKLAAQN
ncbi:S41 family peptidase [uncultured Roseibium sp.]|uniref:S41 family peptidase n=1 Tax=uncultured Roseibium sp. TaxID=1936171 RepID=UPI0026353501|nr:S41 family peptidase [uncultured Roseibium sp.]